MQFKLKKEKKFLTLEKFNEIYSMVPRLCVDILIIKENKILLTKRNIPPFRGFWHLPGGSVLLKEKIKNAIKRVAKSELGIKIKNIKFIDYYEILNEGKKRHAISLVFKCNIVGNAELKIEKQASTYNFFSTMPNGMILQQKKFIHKNSKKIFEK